jgi:hypothetical protein
LALLSWCKSRSTFHDNASVFETGETQYSVSEVEMIFKTFYVEIA